MNDRPSFFPRLHTDDLTVHARESIKQSIDSIPGLDALIRSFEKATGWLLAYHELPRSEQFNSAADDGAARQFSRLRIDDLSERIDAGQRPVSRADCDSMAEAMDEIINHLHQTRSELRGRSAELATAVPVVRKGSESGFADLLESLLRSAAQLIGAEAAGIYLLDDSTTELNLRVSVGLPNDRLNVPSRPLAGAAGDLEALVGHAVVVKDAAAIADWNIPENFGNAVCLPVATATVPLGTMWLFSDSMREITSEDTDILEIIAGRIASELERESVLNNACADRVEIHELERMVEQYRPQEKDRRLLVDILGDDWDFDAREQPENGHADQQVPRSKFTPSEIDRAVKWQRRTEPVMMPMLDGWQIGGRCRSNRKLNCAFHGWQVLPDSRIAFFLGDSCGDGIEAALTAASVRAAIKSLANQMLDPHVVMERINETLWHDEMGDQFVSLFCGMIDPETGNLAYCTTGNSGATVFDSYDDRNFVDFSEPLGTDIDAVFKSERRILLPGQSLFVYNDGLRQLCPSERVDVEDEGLCETLNMLGGADLGTLNEWVEGRFANRSISSHREPADAAFTLLTRQRQ